MKRIFTSLLFILFFTMAFGQKQTYDILSFSIPTGWQQELSDGGTQLSVVDEKTRNYALIVITKSIESTATPTENFNTDWDRLIKGAVPIKGSITMQTPSQENGWDIISGSAPYTDAGTQGVISLITATGGKKTLSLVLMTNSVSYQDVLIEFLQSLELPVVSSGE